MAPDPSKSSPSRIRAVTLAAALVLAPAAFAAGAPPLVGSFSGTVELAPARARSAASGTLAQSGRSCSGSMTLDAGPLAASFTVHGSVRRARALLRGSAGAMTLRWRARWNRSRQTWRGPFVVRGAGRRVHGFLTLSSTPGGPAAQCGADYFASDVMPTVITPICAQCHVPGGAAQASAFHVSTGDPASTAASALNLVDPADPLHSRLLMKPRGDVAHGGGQRILPGSIEEQVLIHWIELVTDPTCGGGGGGGGGAGGGGGSGTGADLYASSCAACHGADARGTATAPAIRCNRSIHDAVAFGRSGPAGTMPAIALADAEIALVQTYLNGLCPAGGAGGTDLFAANCATCHRADAGGTSAAPSVRCATRVADAVVRGRGARMPAFPGLGAADLTSLRTFLDGLCTASGRTGADLYAGNCASCHGATAGGGRNGLGVPGPGIQCAGAGDYQEAVRSGEDGMPTFPALRTNDVTAIAGWVRGRFCPGG
jgi:mono/diheme cytochrome c family protein